MIAAVAAGFNSLVMQAGMQVVGNGGDIGAALEALASMDTVRALATAMLTAGLGDAALDKFAGTDLAKSIDGLAKKLAEKSVQAGVNTGVGTAINGGNPLVNLRASAVSALGEVAASKIGTAYKNQDINLATRYIAHAALGGAMDVALGGDGTSSAVGAVTGELIADAYVNSWISDKLTETKDMGTLQGEALKAVNYGDTSLMNYGDTSLIV